MKITDEQSKHLHSFMVEALAFTEEENQAIDHQIPMTQEIFDSILDKCMELGEVVDPLFDRMIEEFKDFMVVYADKIEKDIVAAGCSEDME